jgi:electron transport complex protein RnfD
MSETIKEEKKLVVEEKIVPKKKPDPRKKLAQPEKMLILNSSPHLHTTKSVKSIMWSVIAALLPAMSMSIYYFGLPAVWMIITCLLAAVVTEIVMNFMKGEKLTIIDGSAIITGLLLALTLPPSFRLTSAALGSIVAISLGKHIFGGLGYNIFNPALLGRAFLQASFPVAMTTWTNPITPKFENIDAVSTATPLGAFKFERIFTEYSDLLIGNIGGSLGETSALAILIGGIFLLILKNAEWRIPVSVLGTVFVLGGLIWLLNPEQYPDPIFHLLSGGLLFGAFYMATDMVTSPITTKGSWIFGIGIGILVVIIRLFGGLPEGVMFSILLMNGVTPLINRYTRPRIFGEVKK